LSNRQGLNFAGKTKIWAEFLVTSGGAARAFVMMPATDSERMAR
jgi:hypothetical protein